MQFDDFLQRNNISLNPKIYEFSVKGLHLMENSKDSLHSISHVSRIFSVLDIFLHDNQNFKINFNVLLPSICWHDSWRADRNSKSTTKILIEFLFYDGLGSARKTRKAARDVVLQKDLERQIVYCIRKHSVFQLTKRKTLESKLLHDLDTLDTWSGERIESALVHIKKNKALYNLLKWLKRLFLSKKLVSRKEKAYYFDWFLKPHQEAFENFLNTMNTLIWNEIPSSHELAPIRNYTPQ